MRQGPQGPQGFQGKPGPQGPAGKDAVFPSSTTGDAALFLILEWFRSHLEKSPTKDDLIQLQKTILMKLSEIKAAVAAAAAKNTEAFSEISAKITAMQTQIDELIAGNSDPDVTDEAFLAQLQALSTSAAQLADIVPAAPPVEPPTT
jgi:hypothetical protein